MLPSTLKGFAVFVDGRGYAGKLTMGQLPKVTIKTEEHRDGGMDGPVELDMGMEKLEASYEFAEYNSDILSSFGTQKAVTLRGSMEDEDGGVIAILADCRGLVKENDPGEWKPGEKTLLKLMHSLRYYRLTVGGRVVHEIDFENNIRVVDGDDQLAARRQALGQ